LALLQFHLLAGEKCNCQKFVVVVVVAVVDDELGLGRFHVHSHKVYKVDHT